jgi:hypothetical protein
MIIAKDTKDTKGDHDWCCPWGWNILKESVRNNKRNTIKIIKYIILISNTTYSFTCKPSLPAVHHTDASHVAKSIKHINQIIFDQY